MAQSFNIQRKPALGKESIVKYGPVAGAAITIFGFFIFFLGLLFNWVGGSVKLSGFKVLFDNDAVLIRGGFLNGLLCNLPFFLCGSLIIAIVILVGTLWKKMPTLPKLVGPAALGVLTLFSCCPGILFLIDTESRVKDYGLGVNIGIGYFISLFGLAVAFLGGIAAIASAIYGGGVPKFNRQ